MPSHTALIGDIKGSRDLDNWPEVFRKLQETLEEANRRFTDDILIAFKPTVGDEFQGALKTPDRAYDVYTFIKSSLPVSIYCGMGIGEVEKPAEGDSGLRGTAFYRAREALEICKKNKRTLTICLGAERAGSEKIVNTILDLVNVIESHWTERQRQIVNYYRLNPDLTYEKLAVYFGVSKPFVHKVLKATGFVNLSRSERLISELLAEIPDENGRG